MSDTKVELAARVGDIVGGAGLAPAAELAAYAVDGCVPGVVAMPDSVEQVARLLALANEAGYKVVPWGGGTAMGVGGIPSGVDIVLSTARLAAVLDYSPDDMTITVQAGATLAMLQGRMAGHGQMLPLDPPLPARSTVGGVLATNASGPLRYQFGMPRDLALGAVVVYPDGTVARSGGRTVKNVAGYDMTRLHIGAYGTLGVIVEATFKVAPLPKMQVTVAGQFASLAAAVLAARALRMARIVPWSLLLAAPGALAGAGDGYTVAVRLGGQPAVVTPQQQRALDTLHEAKGSDVREVAQAEEMLWPQARDWPLTAGDSADAMVRIGVAPSQMQNVLSAAQDIAARHGLAVSSIAFPGAATVYCSLSGAPQALLAAAQGLTAVTKEWNGNLLLERCPLLLKQHMSVWQPGEADALTRRVKQTYDARATLNPARFVGGL